MENRSSAASIKASEAAGTPALLFGETLWAQPRRYDGGLSYSRNLALLASIYLAASLTTSRWLVKGRPQGELTRWPGAAPRAALRAKNPAGLRGRGRVPPGPFGGPLFTTPNTGAYIGFKLNGRLRQLLRPRTSRGVKVGGASIAALFILLYVMTKPSGPDSSNVLPRRFHECQQS